MTAARIISARRTPVCPSGGALSGLGIEDLALPAIAAALADAGLAAGDVDGLVVGNALGAGGNPARRIALAAGMERVAGLTIDRQCTSGLDALLLAKALVDSGAARIVVAGGVESHSRRPFRAHRTERGPLAYEQAPFTPWPDRDPDMAAAADRLGLTRRDQDLWAMASHDKALRAGVPADLVAVNGVTRDPFARRLGAGLLARAPRVSGDITAANMAVAADGAAFAVIVHPRLAAGRGGMGFCGLSGAGDPMQPGLAPIPVIGALLAREGIGPAGLARIELMEAFAAQALACLRGAGLPAERTNPDGGALARGHPIGASGAVLATTMFHGLRSGTGLAAIAGAGGIATAALFFAGER